nr:reverse transcriptase domain-containing protein [Tanacetum cinerariifolium]
MDTSKSSLSSKFSQKPSTSSMDSSKRIDDSTENYSLFEVNYDGMFAERPLSYEDVYGGGFFDISGSLKGFDCIEEPMGCDDGSLPVKIKDEFKNEVILDDVVSSPANLSMLLKRKGNSRVKFTRMKGIIKRSKMVSLRIQTEDFLENKLKSHWSGPFTISHVFPYGTVELSQPDGPNFKVNGHRLKHYFGEDVPKMVVLGLQTFLKDQ